MNIAGLNPRPCERQCRTCKFWKHFSRFRSKEAGKRSLARFSPDCRECETKQRNERKIQDRPLWILRERAKDYATKYGVSFDFLWINMNWRALVPPFRAVMTDEEALCTSCGHAYDNERDIQIEHVCPPRNKTDYARLHARNITLRCGSCNRTKSGTPYEAWLDRQEEARLSNEGSPSFSPPISPKQPNLFGWDDKQGS
jgi:hypothetical protein